MMNKILYIITLTFIYGCGTQRSAMQEARIEESLLDTLVVSAPKYELKEDLPTLPIYNEEAARNYDIIHTSLDLRFDWEKEHVLGKAEIILKPYFAEIDHVVLDAKGFIINKVILNGGSELMYEYDDKNITILLPRSYNRNEKLTIDIDYIARPSEGPIGGSAAITSDKGLFFINPRGETPNKPRQIWTQGETENNSRWFPTFDKPNEKMTQEIRITVNDTLQTLSNGELISSVKNSDGTRTDYWKQDLPHAPYLTMVAVGTFAKVEDRSGSLLLEYWVDPPYEKDAKKIFNHTPEMIEYFSNLLQYPFPWDKYSQIVVEDFVSGAMENTSASVFGDFVQKTEIELIDNDNDNIVAHELFHQWFGNVVTTESWANLTLNEGFANYSEYLWREHKYGKSEAEAHRYDEMQAYLYTIENSGTHPLIHYGYHDKEEMFDVHSYNKGGLVLHMLRKIVGDEAFFTSLNHYLNSNEFTAVEVDELRMAFEETLGRDMNWFFDQWFNAAGHPILEVTHSYDEVGDVVTIKYEQIQSKEEHKEIFILPLEVAIYDADGTITYHPVELNKRRGQVEIKGVDQEPKLVRLDGKRYILGEINEDHDASAYEMMLRHSPHFMDKVEALEHLDPSIIKENALVLINSDHASLRMEGIAASQGENAETIEKLILTDPNSNVRALALVMTRRTSFDKGIKYAKQVMDTDPALTPIGPAVSIFYEEDSNAAMVHARKLMEENGKAYLPALSEVFAYDGNKEHLVYFEKYAESTSNENLLQTYTMYKDLLINQDLNTIYNGILKLEPTALNSKDINLRYLSTDIIIAGLNTMETLKVSDEDKKKFNIVENKVSDIISKETDPFLKMKYTQM